MKEKTVIWELLTNSIRGNKLVLHVHQGLHFGALLQHCSKLGHQLMACHNKVHLQSTYSIFFKIFFEFNQPAIKSEPNFLKIILWRMQIVDSKAQTCYMNLLGLFVLRIMTINFFWILKCRVYFLYIFTSFGFYIFTSLYSSFSHLLYSSF